MFNFYTLAATTLATVVTAAPSACVTGRFFISVFGSQSVTICFVGLSCVRFRYTMYFRLVSLFSAGKSFLRKAKAVIITNAFPGASGFVAAEIVYQLLEQGWEVHGTVRHSGEVEKYDFLNKVWNKIVLFLSLYSPTLF